MYNYSKIYWAGFVVFSAACSNKKETVDESNYVSTGGAANQNSATEGAAASLDTSGATVIGAGGTDAVDTETGVGGTTNAGGNKSSGGAKAGTGGGTICGSGVCTWTNCGSIVDYCGNVIDCGYGNCPADVCGRDAPNECPPCAKIDCKSAGNKNCGPMSDGCGGIIDCGTCTEPQCCGCGSSGSPAVANVCGGNAAEAGSGLSSTCLAGTQGCLCDTMGGCAPGLTCAKTRSPAVCCGGTTGSMDCDLPLNRNIGASCSGTPVAACTPGITIPSATGNNDNCGYPASSFRESVFMCGITAEGGGPVPAQIQAFMNDEHAMTLGCETGTYPVSPMPSNPGTVYYPQTGDPTCTDTERRPMRPALYITDITADPNCRAGDQQQGGEPYDPIAIFGTWKAATGNTPGPNPDALNYWDLGTSADPVPAAVTAQCPCVAGSCVTTGHDGRGYGVETRYEAALLGGHSYRFQIIGHDGDQTQGADAGEACVIFCAEGDSPCIPTPCPSEFCGKTGDGCGGILDCGPCCLPKDCDDVCPANSSGNIRECSSTKDAKIYAVECTKSDECGGTINCFCPIG